MGFSSRSFYSGPQCYFGSSGHLQKANPAWIKPIVALFSVTFVAMSIVAWKYFFIGPAITELLIASCLATAFFRTTA